MTHSDEPAFPIVTESAIDSGLTKREYFAAIAMQGCLASIDWKLVDPAFDVATVIAGAAVVYADALINALNESK